MQRAGTGRAARKRRGRQPRRLPAAAGERQALQVRLPVRRILPAEAMEWRVRERKKTSIAADERHNVEQRAEAEQVS